MAGFHVAVAVEIDKRVTPTYRVNHPGTMVLESDIRNITGDQILRAVPEGKLDLLMGCAPCQGFCSLTAKHKRTDPRNELVLEMARLIEETSPKFVLMENVPGLALRGRDLLNEFTSRLISAGYHVSWGNVQMADYGLPQMRRRLVLLAGRELMPELPPATHARCPKQDQRPWNTLRDAIHGNRAATRLSVIRTKGGPVSVNWHVIRDLKPKTIQRLRATVPGQMRFRLNEALLPNCHRQGYDGFRNVYMRMTWDEPSPTITSGCTTPAKGRFGHPDCRRTTISVREAAAIQSFPDSFQFETESIDTACEMIGNAVPPVFAMQLAEHIRKML